MSKEEMVTFLTERFGDILTDEDFALLDTPQGWQEVRRRLSWRVRHNVQRAQAV